jgi:hypothetical protein
MVQQGCEEWINRTPRPRIHLRRAVTVSAAAVYSNYRSMFFANCRLQNLRAVLTFTNILTTVTLFLTTVTVLLIYQRILNNQKAVKIFWRFFLTDHQNLSEFWRLVRILRQAGSRWCLRTDRFLSTQFSEDGQKPADLSFFCHTNEKKRKRHFTQGPSLMLKREGGCWTKILRFWCR